MQKHNWKTPFEKVTGMPPNLSHLRQIGCKAYAIDKHILQKEKLQKRAHIGHLIGYDSTNIFLVWIPSQRKIIRTRDVLFDETSLYNPSEPDLAQLTMEPMTESAILNIPELVSSGTQIFEIESDDNELETSDQPEKKTSPLLPMPDPTKISLPLSRENSGTSFELSESETLTSERQTNLPLSQNLARCANEISSAFDAANILPEGVGETRQNAYAIGLEHSALERLMYFHTAF